MVLTERVALLDLFCVLTELWRMWNALLPFVHPLLL